MFRRYFACAEYYYNNNRCKRYLYTLSNDAFTAYAIAGNGDVWYRFTACNTGTATIATSSSTTQDLDLFVFNASCPTDNNTNIANATNGGNTETVNANVIAGQIYYIRVAKYSGTSGAFTITVTAGAAAPSISAASLAAQTLCINTPANTLSVTTTNATAYQWYKNTTASNSGGSLIEGATLSTYTPVTSSAGTTYYYAVVSNDCASTTSTVSGAIKVNPAPTAALSGTPTTCAGDATNITVTLTGAQPWTIVYNDGTDHTVANITASPYSLSVAPTSNTTYSLVSVNDANACAGGTVSGTATVTVNPATTITQQPTPNDQEICQNSTGATLTVAATGTGTLSYQWFKTTQNNNTSGSSVGAANGGQTSTYTIPTTASGNSYYYVKITSSVCGTITSNVSGRITVSSTVIGAGPAPASQTICQNTSASTISVSSVSGIDIDYTWYSNATNSNVGGTPVPGGPNSRSFTPTATSTSGTTYYYVVVDGQCGSAVSNVATVIVTPATSITGQPSATPQTVCQNAPVTALSVTAIGTNVSYQWFSNTTASTTGGTAVGNNSNSYTPSTATAGTLYYYVVVSGSCSPTSVVSQVSGAIKVNPLPTASISGTTSVCQNSTAPGVTFTGANGTAPYTFSYTISGDNTTHTIASSGNTATVSVPTSTTGTITYTLVSVTDASSTACSNTASGSASVTVNVTPTATVTSPSSACEGSSVGVTFSGTAGSTITYTLNGVQQPAVIINTNGDNVTINSPSNEGSYTYTITGVTLGNCDGTAGSSTTITINPAPAVAEIIGNNYVAVGKTVTLSDATIGGTWTIDNSTATISNQTNSTSPATVTIHGETAGTPTISYTTAPNSFGCTNTATMVINVYDPSLARFRTIADGYATDVSIWEVFTGVPDMWEPAENPPTNNSNIEVRHNVSLLYANFNGSSSSSFVITGHVESDVTVPGTLTIAPTHYFRSAGAVNFNNNLVVLQSDETATAAIGEMTNGTIANATNVQVERYIGVNTTSSHPGRSWRLLTAPVTGTTINDAWQEGHLWDGITPDPTPAGLGTLITGYAQGSAANANANGYDFWAEIARNNSSIRNYTPGTTNGTWSSFPSITGKDISYRTAYMLFVRGDRHVTTGSGSTTLRAKGLLNQGPQTIEVSPEYAYTLVGNPFASTIDFDQVFQSNASVIMNKFLMWDANKGTYGAYTLVDGSGGAGYYTTVPFPMGEVVENDNARYIPSGAGFFVYPADGGTLTIDEAAKNPDMTGAINPFRENAYLDKKLYVNLNLKDSTSTSTLADGLLARFDNAYSAAIDADDAQKQPNFNENLGIQNGTASLMVEARPDIVKTDTLQLKMWNLVKRTYELQLKADRFDSVATLYAWLEDSYLNTKEPISLTGNVSTFSFTITSDSASWKRTASALCSRTNQLYCR